MKINKNMGRLDRTLRIIGAVLIGILLLTGVLHGVLGIVLGILGIVWLVTGIISFCPVYVPFGISTCSCGCKQNGKKE